MKQHNFFKLLGLLALMLVIGCNTEKYNDPLASVYQTQWQGSYYGVSEQGKSLQINVDFTSDTIMSFTVPEYSATCIYKREGRVIFVKQQSGGYEHFGDVIGAWWIDKLTPTELILTLDHGTKYSKKLVLTKIK